MSKQAEQNATVEEKAKEKEQAEITGRVTGRLLLTIPFD
jgi:hypothetical protein